jgi:hypothetical protein
MATPSTRATDSDRNNICQVLDSALSDGQLSMEEHRDRISAATKATTLGDLQALLADLQIHRAPATIPARAPRTRRRAIRFAVAAAVTVACAAIGWAVLAGNGSPSPPVKSPGSASVAPAPAVSAPTTAVQPAASLLTLPGISKTLAAMRSTFGDTLGYELSIYPGYAVLDRPDTANAHEVVEWLYGGSEWTKMGPGIAIPSAVVGDLGAFDVQAVVGVVHDAPQTLKLYDASQTYLIVESEKDGSLRLSVHASDTGRGGSIVVGADGSIKDIVPPER